MQIICSFNSLEVEVAAKNASMLSLCEDAESDLLNVCARKLSRDLPAVEKVLAFAKSLAAQDGAHASLQLYLSHPIRVATRAVEMESESNLDTALLGLLHNVFEVCGLSEDDLENAGYGHISRGVRLLTIRRESETDTEYLTKFYGDIEAYGQRLSLIRCVDKLDNLLGLELLNDGPVRESYLDLAEQFVQPMASRLAPEFGVFFQDVVDHMRSRGCDATMLAEYERFTSQQAPAQ